MKHQSAPPNSRRSRAFAILTVVLILFALVIVGAPFLVTMQLHNKASRNLLFKARAKYSALAAANHASASLVSTIDSVEASAGSLFLTPSIDVSSEFEVDFADFTDANGDPDSNYNINAKGIMVSVSVEDEQGKVNLNSAPELLLQNIFTQAEITTPATLAGAVVYFRANRHPFRSLGEIQLCSDADLPSASRYAISVDELARLREYCTVYSSKSSDNTYARHPVNVNTAPRDVLISVFKGLTYRDPVNPETVSTRNTGGGDIVGDGVLSEISFPSGFTGENWTLTCTSVTGASPRQFKFSVSNGSTTFSAYTFTSTSSTVYESTGGEISFRITCGGTDFAANDQFVINVNEKNSGVSQAAAEQFADRVRVETTLEQDLALGATEISLNESDGFPAKGWINIDGDLIEYIDNDPASDILTINSVSEYENAGIGKAATAGTKVELIFTDWSDLHNVLNEAVTANEITADDKEAIYRSAVDPLGDYVGRSTTGLIFRSGNAYTVEAAGIINSNTGQELSKFVTRRVIQPSQSEENTWLIDSQKDFRELLQQNPQDELATHTNLTSMRDQVSVGDNIQGVAVTVAPNSGTSTLKPASVSSFFHGQRIDVVHDSEDKVESANIVEIDTDSMQITIDKSLVEQYSGGTKIYPAGSIALNPRRVVVNDTYDTAAAHFDEGTFGDILNLDTSDGTNSDAPNAGTIYENLSSANPDNRNVSVEGVYIGEDDIVDDGAGNVTGALAYRSDTGNIATSTDDIGLSVSMGQLEFWFKPLWDDTISRDYHLFDMASDEYKNRLSLKLNKLGVDSSLSPHLVMRITDTVRRDADPSEVSEAHISEVRVPVSFTGSVSDKLKIETNVWHHAKLMWKGTDYGQMAMFVDGRLAGSYWPSTRLKVDNLSTDANVDLTYSMTELTSRTGEYPAEFSDKDVATKIISHEIFQHNKIASYSNPQPLTVSAGNRAMRRTVARPHYAGEAVTHFGYVYNINQVRHHSRTKYLNNYLMLGTPIQYTLLAHKLSTPGNEPEGTVYLQDPNEAAAHIIVGEHDGAGGPTTNTIFLADGTLSSTTEYIPFTLSTGKDEFPSSGFILTTTKDADDNDVTERIYYDNFEEDHEFKVMVSVNGQAAEARTITVDALHVWTGPPGGETPADPQGRAELGSDDKLVLSHTDIIKLVSVELRNDADFPGNANYARGFYRPFVPFGDLPQGQQDSWITAGLSQAEWENGPGREHSDTGIIALGDKTGATFYEWISYVWPTLAVGGSGGDGDDDATRQVATGTKHYLVAPSGLGRNQGSTSGGEHPGSPTGSADAARVVYPVYFANASRVGINDRVTLRDDDGNEEEKVILHASSDGRLFTISSKELPEEPAWLTTIFEYTKHPRILKFPTGRRPQLPSVNMWLGSSAPIGSVPSKDAANSTFSQFKIRRDSIPVQNMHSILDDPGGAVPVNKRSFTTVSGQPGDPWERFESRITPTLEAPFSIRIGNLNRFRDYDTEYPVDSGSVQGRWYGTTLGIPANTDLPPWMWQSTSGSSWPRFGYVMIDTEVFFYQMLYVHPTSNAIANVAASVTEIPEATLAGITELAVDSTEGFAESGYAVIEFHIRNSAYWVNADPWLRTATGGVQTSGDLNLANPNYLGARYDGLLTYYSDPYISVGNYYYNPHNAAHFEVIFYQSKTDTSFKTIQRGLLDTVPYTLPGPGNDLFDYSELGPPSTFTLGITAGAAAAGPRKSGLAGNSYLQVRALNGVEIQILQRAAMGTSLDSHAIGSPMMPIEDTKTVVLTGPLNDNGTLPAQENSLADENNLTREALFPKRGLLELGTGEIVGYSSRSQSAFGGIHTLRERYGSSAVISSGKDYLKTLPPITDLDTNPTPDFFPDTIPSAVNGSPYIARLLPIRYFDGFPRQIDDSGASVVRKTDYDAQGAVYLKASRTVRGAEWNSLKWSGQLPTPADSSKPFKIHVVARFNGDAGPSWDSDPDTTEGLFHFTSSDTPQDRDKPSDPGNAVFGWFHFTSDGKVPSVTNRGTKSDKIELRIFFEYPDKAYDPYDGRQNDWKKTPFLDRIKVTYKTQPRVLHTEDVKF
ncbi:MAG: type II secretion system protein GspK [Planctomycetota bacterium]|nr:type II secretion system protein GspK [Planctomycetota bacterium]